MSESVEPHRIVDPGLVQQLLMYPTDGIRVEHIPGGGRHEQVRAARVLFMLLDQQSHRFLWNDHDANRIRRLGELALHD